MWKLLLFPFCTPNWSDTEDILSCGTMYSGRYIDISEEPADFIIRVKEAAGSFLVMLHIYQQQWLDQGDS